MKRSKYEERSMGPMFPRLHVNDTERGGPRAPPRNKMALYEQLTTPSNRHNPGNMQPQPNSGASQGTGNERIVYFPSYQTPVTRPLPSHSADRLQRHPSDAVNLRSLASQAEQRRKPEDEDDFAVPIFSRSGKEQSKVAHQSRNDEGRCRAFSSSCSMRLPNTCNKENDQADSESLSTRQDAEDQGNEQTTVIVSSSDPKIREPSCGAMKLQEDARMGDHLDTNRTSRFKYINVHKRYSDSCGPTKEAEGRISLRLKSNPPLRQSNMNEFDCEDKENQREDSLVGENMDRDNDVSRTPNVATIVDLDVSPDAVVDVIGLKHFWKARRAIVNQQRVFAVQVFELHRLMKVQQLIAESPEILIYATAFLGKSSIKVTPLKNIPPQYTVKALAYANTPKDNFQNPNPNSNNNNNNNKTEGSSENAVAESPSHSPPTPSHPLTHPQFPPNPSPQIPPPPMAIPQPGGHQWLVPIMSPSEGLIYKPYPGPAFSTGPVCGGCEPHGPKPHPAHHHFMPSPYYHHPGATPFNVQGYFPPYGMSAINSAISGSAVDQINHQSGSNPNGETGQTVIRMPNFSVQQQGSCNKPSQRHSELLGSTGSSPCERVQDIVRPRSGRKEKVALTLFPSVVPPPPQPHPCETEQPSTVIKVVPHNARTATQSAARIFRSIQEERRQSQPNY